MIMALCRLLFEKCSRTPLLAILIMLSATSAAGGKAFSRRSRLFLGRPRQRPGDTQHERRVASRDVRGLPRGDRKREPARS